jgi:DNA repair exonuclease SbcCD ATPase subunit
MDLSPAPRRFLTMIGVALAMLLAVGTIRAAAAWTAASAPLTVAPTSVATLQARLLDEQARSAALQRRLDALTTSSGDLASALEQARARIDADTANAADLSAQLDKAKRRLAKLDAAIAAANRTTVRTTRATVTRVSASSRTSGGGVVEHEAEHEGG